MMSGRSQSDCRRTAIKQGHPLARTARQARQAARLSRVWIYNTSTDRSQKTVLQQCLLTLKPRPTAGSPRVLRIFDLKFHGLPQL